MKSFKLFLIFIFSFMANSEMNFGLMNIDWQKKYLESDIKSKIESKLDKVLSEKIYTVDVEIKTTIPKKPSFKQTPSQPPEAIKYTNSAKSNPGDYIVFSKFGLESPIAANMEKKDSPQNSEYEFMWKFQESQSIYNNLESIVITVGLPENLEQAQRDYIEEIVKTTPFNLKDFQVQINFKYLNLTPVELFKPEEKPPVDDGLVNKQTMDLLEKIATPVGLLLSSLVISLCAFILFKKYSALRNDILTRKIQLEGNQKSESKEDKKEESQAGAGGGGMGAPGEGEDLSKISGIDRFKYNLVHSFDVIILMVKSWLKNLSDNEQKALVLLLDRLEGDELNKMFDKLSMSERNEWKMLIEKVPYSSINREKIDKFIGNEVINNFIVPDVVTDVELKNKLMSLNEDSALSLINENPDLAPVLLSVSPIYLINKIISSLTKDVKNLYLSQASKLDLNKSKEFLSVLNQALTKYCDDVVVSPFLEKIIKLIPTANYKDEESLYDILIDNNLHKKISSLAISNFPSFLIGGLDDKTLNKVFMSFSMSERAEVIESFDDPNLKKSFINSFAKEGSTALQMYNLEIERFQVDENAKLQLLEKKDESLSKLYKMVKDIVKKDEDVQREAKNIISNWLSMKNQSKSGNNLKLAS